jgi:hypothetical protein
MRSPRRYGREADTKHILQSVEMVCQHMHKLFIEITRTIIEYRRNMKFQMTSKARHLWQKNENKIRTHAYFEPE